MIRTSHDGFRAFAIMLRSNVASSEIASEASLRNYIDHPSSEQIIACSDFLCDALSAEGHISQCNRVLRLYHPEQSSCSGLEQFVYYLSCKKTCVRFDLPNCLSF